MADDLPYQQASQVRQLLGERETADAYGMTTRVEAVDKQLAELGYRSEKQAAEKRAAAAEGDEDEARAKPPTGRTTRAKATTDQAKPKE